MISSSPHELPRLQFSLRWLFVIVTATAFCAFILRIAGLVETIGVAVAFTLCGICLHLPTFRFRRSVWGGLLTLATIIVWMVGVDYSTFHEECEYCSSSCGVAEIRVFHQPVWFGKGDDARPTLRLIAEDLGAPCPHRYQRWQLWRLWGLFWPGPPFFNGIIGLADGDWYLRGDRAHVRSLGAQDPNLGKKFQAALLTHNYATIRRIISEVRTPPKADAAVK